MNLYAVYRHDAREGQHCVGVFNIRELHEYFEGTYDLEELCSDSNYNRKCNRKIKGFTIYRYTEEELA